MPSSPPKTDVGRLVKCAASPSDRLEGRAGVHWNDKAEMPRYLFLTAAAHHAAGITLGAGRGEGRQMGPLLTVEARVRILAQIQSATDSGASVVCGGMAPEPAMSGFYLEPTILRDVRRDMEPSGDESIGPVLP